MKYVVVNGKTGERVSTCSTIQRARNKRDKFDNEYGAYIYHIKELDSQQIVL